MTADSFSLSRGPALCFIKASSRSIYGPFAALVSRGLSAVGCVAMEHTMAIPKYCLAIEAMYCMRTVESFGTI